MKWTAREIGRQLYIQAFSRRHLIVVPNCLWPGAECDILVVRNDLRLMDVEIKISRQDLKADAGKDKWIDISGYTWDGTRTETPRSHPRKIWKHYYAMPEVVWKDGMEEFVKPCSGIILMRDHLDHVGLWIHRQAKPNKEYEKISAADVCDIARLASDRMWRAQHELDTLRRREAMTP